MRPSGSSTLGLILATAVTMACGAEAPRVALGPADGHDLPPVDTGRVAVGAEAPDFTLASFDDGLIRLSDYRGKKNVILVFYRGSW